MATITGNITRVDGTLYTGRVTFTPDSALKLIGTDEVTGHAHTVDVVDGDLSVDLVAGSYAVAVGSTDTFSVVVPSGSGTYDIAALIDSGAANLPTVTFRVPSGGTTGQVLAKASDDDGDTEWVDQAGGAGTPASTVVSETSFGQDAAVGTATEFARADHTHGTPATPTAGDVGADSAGTAAAAVASHEAGAGVHAIAATTGLQTALDAKAAASALTSHTTDTANPHAVTAAQVGADASGTAASAVSAHAGGSGVHSIAGVTGLQSALDERTGSSLAILGEGARTLVSGSVFASTVQDNHVRQTVASSTACVVRISFGNYISPFGGGACGYNEFDLSTSFRAMLVVAFDGFVSSAAKAAIYIPGANTETASVIGAKGIGIHVVGNAAGNQLMSVAVHNGTSLTESTPAEMAAGSSKSHNIALEWRAGVSATLYVNGVQWGQVTTGLPTGTIPSARFIAAVFDTGAGVGAYSTFGIRGILVESL